MLLQRDLICFSTRCGHARIEDSDTISQSSPFTARVDKRKDCAERVRTLNPIRFVEYNAMYASYPRSRNSKTRPSSGVYIVRASAPYALLEYNTTPSRANLNKIFHPPLMLSPDASTM
jgi:hypothetical protein